jgi:hypothetical protein
LHAGPQAGQKDQGQQHKNAPPRRSARRMASAAKPANYHTDRGFASNKGSGISLFLEKLPELDAQATHGDLETNFSHPYS